MCKPCQRRKPGWKSFYWAVTVSGGSKMSGFPDVYVCYMFARAVRTQQSDIHLLLHTGLRVVRLSARAPAIGILRFEYTTYSYMYIFFAIPDSRRQLSPLCCRLSCARVVYELQPARLST